jgi:hypothetical protein
LFHEVWNADEIGVLNNAGVLQIYRNSRVALNRPKLSERIALDLHANARVDDETELTAKGRTIETVAALLCDMGNAKFTDEGRQELLRVMVSLFPTRPDGPIQSALEALDPSFWMIKGRVDRTGVDGDGNPFSANAIPVWAVTQSRDLLNRYDLVGRAKKARAAATSRRSYDLGMAKRIPEIAVDVMAAARWNAEAFGLEAEETYKALTANMNDQERQIFDAKVDPKVIEYRDQERLAITAPAETQSAA